MPSINRWYYGWQRRWDSNPRGVSIRVITVNFRDGAKPSADHPPVAAVDAVDDDALATVAVGAEFPDVTEFVP